MKLLHLDVEGFRSLGKVKWSPGDLNVMIGPNGSGKTNLLRLLELLSVSALGGLGKQVQSEGGMDALVWDGLATRISITIKTSPLEGRTDIDRESLTYSLELNRLGHTSAYRIENELLANYYLVETGAKTDPFKFLERHLQQAVVYDENERGLVAPEETISEEESLLSKLSGPFTQNHLIPLYQKELASWNIYHDLHTHREAPIRQASQTRTEKTVEPDGQNLISVLHTLYTGDRDFKKEINTAMRAAFGDEFEELVFPPGADSKIQLRVRWKSLKREQSAAELSDGILRFLFLLTVLGSPSLPPLIAIDEPEIGLHPSMLPIIAEYAVEASHRTQVIFTTHSPDFLDAFRDTIPTTTVVEWIEGKTRLKIMSGDTLDYWLKQYSLGEMFRSNELETSG